MAGVFGKGSQSAPAGDSLGGAAEASHDEPAEAAAPVLSSWALSMVERWRLAPRSSKFTVPSAGWVRPITGWTDPGLPLHHAQSQ